MPANDLALTQVPISNEQLDHLYKQHHGWLHNWLKRKLGCPENAADIAQDTFVRIIKSRHSLLGMREPRAYLATTAKRLLIDRSRRDIVEKTYLSELMVTAETLKGHPSPEQTWLAIEALQHISQLLAQLPEKSQQTFLLYYLDGLSQVEIAKQLGVTARTVRSHLVKVLVHCQQYQDEA